METNIFGQWWRSHQSLACKGLHIFRFCVMSWKGESEPDIKFCFKRKLIWFKGSPQYRKMDTIDGEPMEFEWNIFPGFTTLQLINEVHEFVIKMGDTSQFKGRNIFMSMFNDILWRSEDNERECNANATLVSLFAKRFPAGHWSFLGPGSEKKWYSTYNERPRGEWDRVAELMMIKFRESGHPVFRATSPLSRGTLKKQRRWKIIDTFLCRLGYDWNCFFAQLFLSISSVSTEQSQMCVRNTVLVKQERARPVLAGQSDPLFEPASLLIMTPRLSIEIPAQEHLLQKYKEPVERFPQQDRVIKICTDAGFLKTVEVGQYFMTKHTGEFSQFTEPVTCREYTLPRDEKLTDPKGWIRGNTNIGPVLEVTTSDLQGKYGVEIWIESVN